MTTVQLLGIEGSSQIDLLYNNVQQALSDIDIPVKVEAVTDIDEIMKYNVHGIPALILNGSISAQKKVPSVDEIKKILVDFINKQKNNFGMKNILVPTDFSATAKDAYLFALELADKYNSHVKLLNICHPVVATDTAYLPEELDEMVKIAKERMKKFSVADKNKIEKGDVLVAPRVSQEVVIGFPVEEILHQVESGKADFVVMGTTGEKGFLDKMFGSVSIHVSQKAECPVLLVPNGVRFKGFKHIMFASDYETVNEKTLKNLIDLTQKFGSDLHMIHVSEGSDDSNFKAIEAKLVDVLFKGGNPDFAFTISQVESTSVAEGLHDYAEKNNIDLTVLVCPKRGFWKSLFHKSVTKQMAWNTKIPMLTFH